MQSSVRELVSSAEPRVNGEAGISGVVMQKPRIYGSGFSCVGLVVAVYSFTLLYEILKILKA